MKESYLELTEEGKLRGTPIEISDYLKQMIPTYDNDRLKRTLIKLNESIKHLNSEVKKLSREIEVARRSSSKEQKEALKLQGEEGLRAFKSVREILYTRIKETERFNATAPTPNTLIRNSIATMELVKTFDTVLDYSNGKVPETTTGIEISEDFENQLGKIESTYIIDAISYYVNDYRKSGGDTELIQYQDNPVWDSYIITDTFDNICKNCAAEGEIRRKMKDVLFGQEKPLQYVTLFLPIDEKRKAYKKVQFINSVIEEGTEKEGGGWYEGKGTVTEIGRVTLQVSASLYRFLDPHYRSGNAKGIDVSGGFHMRPLALSNRISNMFEEMRRLSHQDVWRDVMDIDLTGFRSDKGYMAVNYIMLKWKDGLQNRTQDMKISHKELSTYGFLPSYGHKRNSEKKRKKERDLDAIARVITQIIADGEIKGFFPNCTNAKYDADKLEVILFLDKKKSPRKHGKSLDDPPANTVNPWISPRKHGKSLDETGSSK